MKLEKNQSAKINVAKYGEVEITNHNDKSIIVTWQIGRRTETGSIQLENGEAVGVINLTGNLLAAVAAAL